VQGNGGRLGRTAIVTGGGSGIGQAIARRFAGEGAAVLVAGRRAEPLEATAGEIREAGGRAATATLDVADEDGVRALFDDLDATLGPRLDVLVNGAGTGSTTTVPDTSLEVWERVFAVNARGTFLMSKHALPRLRRARGAIVNVASVAGMVGTPSRAAYCAAKGAVIAFTRAMAIDHVGDGVRVNCLCPGPPTRRGSRAWWRSRASRWTRSRPASRSAASAPPRRWPPPRCTSPRPRPDSSPAARWWSTAG
jgi:NAD(P)-dependent dehydrogenase (short-subunit alcohol dehydrogenase family)